MTHSTFELHGLDIQYMFSAQMYSPMSIERKERFRPFFHLVIFPPLFGEPLVLKIFRKVPIDVWTGTVTIIHGVNHHDTLGDTLDVWTMCPMALNPVTLRCILEPPSRFELE